jgi:hypothetical protein
MPPSPSFKRVHYGLRPAKNVERKLIMDCLRGLDVRFPIPEYRYVGLGSIYFVDFLLVHRVLRIRSMLSIEEKERDAKRAAFNVPFESIQVEPGETTLVLPEIGLEDSLVIVWLDYDSDLRGPVLEDMAIVAERLQAGSVFAVTVNAVAHQLHEPLPPPEEGARDRREILAELTDRTVDSIPLNATNKIGFPSFLGEFLFDRFDSLVRHASGGVKRFEPLFNFAYADNAQMITIGGMVVDDEAAEKLRECRLSERFEFATGRAQYGITLPLLTVREKAELDRMILLSPRPTAAEVEGRGLPLDQEELDGYWRFNRQYPTFGEYVA